MAARTNLVDENNRNLFPRSSGGHKWEVKVSAESVPSGASEGESFSCPSPGFWELLAVTGVLQPIDGSLQSPPLSSCHLLLCVFSPFISFLTGTLVPVGFRAHLNPGISHLKTLNLITNAKICFPTNVTFVGSRIRPILWRGHHSTHCTVF